ncbi:MAG TPA: hypothetical protein VF526_09970 [Solirubrobacteraceae bacterium]|jgi:hypothetical protein
MLAALDLATRHGGAERRACCRDCMLGHWVQAQLEFAQAGQQALVTGFLQLQGAPEGG